jgi:hypothetical protein
MKQAMIDPGTVAKYVIDPTPVTVARAASSPIDCGAPIVGSTARARRAVPRCWTTRIFARSGRRSGAAANRTVGRAGLRHRGDFAGGQFQGGKFDVADLRDADFTRADLRHERFKNGDVRPFTWPAVWPGP